MQVSIWRMVFVVQK